VGGGNSEKTFVALAGFLYQINCSQPAIAETRKSYQL